MSKTADLKTTSFDTATSTGLLARFLAAVDRALLANARIAIRNGDLPRVGL